MPFTRYKFSIIYATIKVAIMPSGNPFKFAEAVVQNGTIFCLLAKHFW